jgi:hypothetical protein
VSFDPTTLATLPGVDKVERDGEQIRAIGSHQLVAPVCAAVLGDDHMGPPDLRVHHPDLEDALIALIDDTTTEHPSQAGSTRTREGAGAS